MESNKDKILERIGKLIDKAQSSESIGSIHEAEIFMNKARQLLIQYNLSESDIKKKEDDYIIELLHYNEIVNIKSNDGIIWVQSLINIICEYNLTKYIHLSKTYSYYIVGTKVNIDFTKNLINTMIPVFLNLCSKRWSEHQYQLAMGLAWEVKRNKFRRDYLDGVVIGVNLAYKKEKEKQEEEEKTEIEKNKQIGEEGPITTLIRVNEIIIQEKVNEFFNDLKSVKNREKKLSNAVDIGIEDGSSYQKDKFIE